MKWLFAGAAILLLQLSVAFAGSCRPLQYAELKDTPSETLVSTYCRYGKLACIDEETASKLDQLARKYQDRGLSSSALATTREDIARHEASVAECFEQQSKISSALENRSQPAHPNCEGQ